MSDHDICSPSVLFRRELCPASALAEQGIPDKPTEHALLGTAYHAYMQEYVEAWDKQEPVPVVEPPLDKDVINIAITQLEVMDVGGFDEMLTEQTVSLHNLGITKGGIVDFVGVSKERLGIVEYKFGHVPVKYPQFNRQLQAYAVGVAHQYGLGKPVETHIIGPHFPTPLMSYTFMPHELLTLSMEICEIVANTLVGQPEYNPGEEQCRYCKAKTTCKAIEDVGMDIVAVSEDMPAVQVLANLSLRERGEFYGRLKTAKAWIGSVEETVREYMLGGGEVQGYKLGKPRTTTKWKNKGEALHFLSEKAQEFNKRVNDITVPLSPAQARKLFGKDSIPTELLETTLGKRTILDSK